MNSNENEISIKRVRRSTSKDNLTNKGKRPFFLKAFAFVFFVVSAYLGFMYYRASNELKLLKNPEEQTAYLQKKIEGVVQEMSKYVVINPDDKPVFAGIVENPEALKKEQAFFSDVSAGDYIFVFEKTQRAIIWNPTKKMVVNFGIYNREEAPKGNTASATTEKKTTTTDKDTDNK